MIRLLLTAMGLSVLLTASAALANSPVNAIAPHKYWVHEGADSLYLPVLVNRPLENLDQITDVFILIHGGGRGVMGFTSEFARARQAGLEDEILMVAPQFLMPIDLLYHQLDTQVLYWTDGWSMGLPSLSLDFIPYFQRPFVVDYSFSVIDAMLQDAVEQLPNLERVLIAGYSGGGSSTIRLAGFPLAIHENADVEVRHVAGAPGRLTYLSPYRPVPGTVDQFYLPDEGDCEGYDNYPWGIADIADIMPTTPEEMRESMSGKELHLYVGDQDVGFVSDACASLLQGENRVIKDQAYYHHLMQTLDDTSGFSLFVIEGLGHDSAPFWHTWEVVEVMYGPWLDDATPEVRARLEAALKLPARTSADR